MSALRLFRVQILGWVVVGLVASFLVARGLKAQQTGAINPTAVMDGKLVHKSKPLLGQAQTVGDATARQLDLPVALNATRPTPGTPTGLVPQLLWGSDGNLLYVLDAVGAVHRITLPNFEETDVLSGIGARGMAMSQSGLLVVQPDTGQLCVLDPDSLQIEKRIPVPSPNGLTASPNSNLAFVTQNEGGLVVVDLEKGEITTQYHAADFGQDVDRGGFTDHVQPLEDFHFPTLSPDGKYFYCESRDVLHRFLVDGTQLKYEEGSPEIGQNPQSLALSPDGQSIALVDSSGNLAANEATKIAPYTTLIFKSSDLQKPVASLASGANPQRLGFDSVTSRIYTHNRQYALMVYTSAGALESQYKLPGAPRPGFTSPNINGILAHPAGKRVLVLTSSALWWFELPGAPAL